MCFPLTIEEVCSFAAQRRRAGCLPVVLFFREARVDFNGEYSPPSDRGLLFRFYAVILCLILVPDSHFSLNLRVHFLVGCCLISFYTICPSQHLKCAPPAAPSLFCGFRILVVLKSSFAGSPIIIIDYLGGFFFDMRIRLSRPFFSAVVMHVPEETAFHFNPFLPNLRCRSVSFKLQVAKDPHPLVGVMTNPVTDSFLSNWTTFTSFPPPPASSPH